MAKWTKEELDNISIISRINNEADKVATKIILEREGYTLPNYASEWTNKQSRDYRYYFKIAKCNIIDNSNLELNERIREDYNEWLNGKNVRIRKEINFIASLTA